MMTTSQRRLAGISRVELHRRQRHPPLQGERLLEYPDGNALMTHQPQADVSIYVFMWLRLHTSMGFLFFTFADDRKKC